MLQIYVYVIEVVADRRRSRPHSSSRPRLGTRQIFRTPQLFGVSQQGSSVVLRNGQVSTSPVSL
jgi:hypothetical protein